MTQRSPKRLPEKYYQRRRAAAVVAIVLVVVLLIWLLTSIGGGEEAGKEEADTAAAGQTTSLAAPTSSSPAPTTTSAAEKSGTETETEDAESKTETEDAESPYPDAPESGAAESSAEPTTKARDERDSCEVSDLVITASSDQATYPAGAQPTFYMTVENPTAADCEIDLDKQNLRFEVYDLATNERIWSDTDCFEPVESGEQTFEAGSERYFEAVWSRRASAPGQCNSRPAVPGGSYFLHAVVGANPSPAHTFNLA